MVLYHTFFIANWILQGFGWLLLRSHKCWSLSHIWLFVTPRTVTHQDPLPVEFSKQEYWGSLPCPPPGDLPDPGIKPGLLHCRQILYHLSHQGSRIHNRKGKGRGRLARIAERKDDNFNIKRIKTLIWRDIFTPMSVAALFTVAKIQQQPVSSIDEWIQKMWYIYKYMHYTRTIEYCCC